MAEEMLTLKQAAARLSLKEDTLRRWLAAGKLHGVKIGATKGGWRVPESEIERILGGSA